MRKLAMGVLGVGEMGKQHATNLRRLVPQAELLAIADVDGARATQVAAELEVPHSYPSLEAMLAGKDILCEKPLGVTIESAQKALEAVAKAGVRLQVGFMRRYDPAYVAAFKRIEAGEIGEPVIFKSLGRDKDMPPLKFYQAGINGMGFYNNTIHILVL